ncbi:MAG: lytic transglycosylase domain-containing protein [Pseudomonadota bacterium]
MRNDKHPKLKKVAYNILGIALLHVLCFYYGRHMEPRAAMADIPDIPCNVRYGDAIAAAARSYGVQPALIAAVIQAESNFNPKAVSNAGARGLMQIVPSTQRHLRLGNAYDPRQNINAGSKYLRELIDTFDGNMVMAIAAYNAGPGAVAQHDGVPPYKETRSYVKKVLAYYSYFNRAFSAKASLIS